MKFHIPTQEAAMTEEIINGVNVDKEYWPKCGTKIAQLPADLNDLWEDHEDEASIFVAEAIISHTPVSHMHGRAITTYLWSVGGDTLTVETPLAEMISDYARDYDKIYSPDQAKDLHERIAILEQIESAIAEAKDYMRAQIADFESEEKD